MKIHGWVMTPVRMTCVAPGSSVRAEVCVDAKLGARRVLTDNGAAQAFSTRVVYATGEPIGDSGLLSLDGRTAERFAELSAPAPTSGLPSLSVSFELSGARGASITERGEHAETVPSGLGAGLDARFQSGVFRAFLLAGTRDPVMSYVELRAFWADWLELGSRTSELLVSTGFDVDVSGWRLGLFASLYRPAELTIVDDGYWTLHLEPPTLALSRTVSPMVSEPDLTLHGTLRRDFGAFTLILEPTLHRRSYSRGANETPPLESRWGVGLQSLLQASF